MTDDEKKAKEEAEKKAKEEAEKKAKEEAEKKAKEDKDKKSIEQFPEEAQKLIKELRKENAERRTKAKELEESFTKSKEEFEGFKKGLAKVITGKEDENEQKPEDLVKELKKKNEKLAKTQKITDLAYENNIAKEHIDYFRYLYDNAIATLAEGTTLPDQALKDIVEKVNAVSKKKKANASVDGKAPDDEQEAEKGNTTLDEFLKMDVLEKSNLFSTHPEVYERLRKEAKKAGKSLI